MTVEMLDDPEVRAYLRTIDPSSPDYIAPQNRSLHKPKAEQPAHRVTNKALIERRMWSLLPLAIHAALVVSFLLYTSDKDER